MFSRYFRVISGVIWVLLAATVGAQVAGALYEGQLTAAYEMGVVSVDMVSVTEMNDGSGRYMVYVELTVDPGRNTEDMASLLKDITDGIVPDQADFSVIIADGESAPVSYYWNYIADTYSATVLEGFAPAQSPTEEPAEEAVEVRTILGNANARSCAATTCDVAGQFVAGDAIRVTGVVEGELVSGSTVWIETMLDGAPAYIHSSLVSEPRTPDVPAGTAIDEVVLGGGEHLELALARAEFRVWLDRENENGLYLVLFGTLSNESAEDRVCIHAEDVRLFLDGDLYTPTSDVMGKVQDLLEDEVDYIGENNGQCVDGGESAETFVAFDAPFGVDEAVLELYDGQEALALDWPEDAEALLVGDLERDVRLLVDHRAEGDVSEVTVAPFTPAVLATWHMREGWSGYNVSATEQEMVQVACDLRDLGIFEGYRFVFTGEVNLVDSYGVTSVGEGMTVWLEADTIGRIACDNVGGVNLRNIASSYDIRADLQ